jgi:hypothetical protein
MASRPPDIFALIFQKAVKTSFKIDGRHANMPCPFRLRRSILHSKKACGLFIESCQVQALKT